jgi:Iap family predicted aminopeptidase
VDSVPQIPAAAVSTVGADLLSELIAKEKTVKLFLKLTCQMLPDVESSNVVGELTGYEKPGEVVLVGGHLDSWDKGQGAHDDGAGCIQAIEALRLLKQLGIRPKRTIRVVLFMNEEFGLSGGIAYAGRLRDDLRHIAAIESDAGGFSPRGFGVSADSAVIARISQWNRLLEPIGADRIEKGGGGADISPLSVIGIPTIGLRVDSQRYFDYHHSDNDTIDTVNERELELGAIAMAILAYLIAEQGI